MLFGVLLGPSGSGKSTLLNIIDELLNALGLTEHQNKFPNQLSGGQQQKWLTGY